MLARLVWYLLSRRRYHGWRDRLAHIRRVYRLDAPALAAWQAEALAKHLRWAVSTIPYYCERAGPGARLEDLPVLTRTVLQTHVESLRSPTRALESMYLGTSGGSTGEPVTLYQDASYLTWDHATEAHVFETWGLDPWCRSVYIWGADRDVADLPAREQLWQRFLQRKVVDAFRMGEAELIAAADMLEKFQPAYIQGYASALERIALWLTEHRPDHSVRPKVIRSAAERLTPAARAAIERAFGTRVFDFYGSRETASIAVECPHGGLHVQAHARVVEVVDENYEPAPPGTYGRLLVTDFTNRVFGLLRYETGDVAAWAPEGPCPCGSAYPRLEGIQGRTSDFIATPAGAYIHGEWFTHLFYGQASVQRFQVYQPEMTRLEVRTVGPADETELAGILTAIRERMGPDVDVAWYAVDTIPTGATGKYRFTRSDVPFRGATS